MKTATPEASWFRRITRKHKPSKVEGGLWHTDDESEQESILLHQVYKLILALSATTIPVTLPHYPTLAKDSRYLYLKFKPVLDRISYEDFEAVFQQTVRPDWIHSFNEHDR